MTYCNFIEEKLKEEAKNKNMLLLNEIYPLYLNVNDETKMFEIYLDNEKILSTKYSNLKNYIIYNNSKEYKASLRLPNTPTSYIKKYLLDDDKLQEIADNAYIKAKEKLTVKEFSDNIRNIFEQRF